MPLLTKAFRSNAEYRPATKAANGKAAYENTTDAIMTRDECELSESNEA